MKRFTTNSAIDTDKTLGPPRDALMDAFIQVNQIEAKDLLDLVQADTDMERRSRLQYAEAMLSLASEGLL